MSVFMPKTPSPRQTEVASKFGGMAEKDAEAEKAKQDPDDKQDDDGGGFGK